ncbi:hypothetical protein FA15DRAFT_624396 [Coprinopsis marcescibilis]|uniref:RRM domain-containing protein n=1 Tax=Coprinopsis marcescibilis TaxID=230819 RepID=A0A5C3KZ12_COPMA|nr:hypothetical protein FA15DRAFT_624396 [Coprinopsis marcescibilis]
MASLRGNARKPYNRPPKGDADAPWQHDLFGNSDRRGNKQGANSAGSTLVSTPSTGVSCKIKVTNLHYEVMPKDLNSIFGQIGTLVREPLLLYDDSGRSRGTALITFETEAEAVRAKKQYDGILAKGQPMKIEFQAPPAPRRSASAPSTASLLNRMEKKPLLERLSRDDTATVQKQPAAGKGIAQGRGRIGPIRAKAPRPQRPKEAKQKQKPKTAEDLDKELDAFMGDSTPASAPPSTDPSAAVELDVEMT